MTASVGFGVFSLEGQPPRAGFRVGSGILDLPANGFGSEFAMPSLGSFLARGRSAWEDVTARALELVRSGADLVPLELARPELPFEVADYVDFYSSLEHASNLGRIFRPDSEPLLPNWRELPVGYHGRAGSVVVSGTPVQRPQGQLPTDGRPELGPTRRLDIELELGFVTGPPGTRISTAEAADHVFGFTLVMPFLPYFVADLGVRGAEVEVWSGIALFTAPFLAALMGPVWGRMTDRYGMKIMVQRIVLAMTLHWTLMYFVSSLAHLLVLRVMLGVFSGFGTISVALVTHGVPKDRVGSVVGTLQSVQILSAAAGPAASSASPSPS